MTSSPYLAAWQAYHSAGTPDTPWETALDFHLQHGLVLSSHRFFLMARPVPAMLPAGEHATLCHFLPQHLGADPTWHIWAAGGDPLAMLQAAGVHGLTPATRISFARVRSPRVRTYPLGLIDRFL